MFERVLEQIAQELDRRKIPYVLIGGASGAVEREFAREGAKRLSHGF